MRADQYNNNMHSTAVFISHSLSGVHACTQNAHKNGYKLCSTFGVSVPGFASRCLYNALAHLRMLCGLSAMYTTRASVWVGANYFRGLIYIKPLHAI